jgi:uncharacterized protein YecE (DUF72 family)
MAKEILIGCSGYYYKDWREKFYPKKLPQKEWLPYYARYFNTVEINNTFYKFPEASMFERWKEITPENFRFTLKGSRYITHMKKLKSVEESLDRFYEVSSVLEDKLASILWQLPPNLKRNDERLEKFCKQLSKSVPQIIEFRNMSWFDEEVFDILQKYNVAYCIISAPGELPEFLNITAPWTYIRFHGKEHWYNYKYSNEELQQWADKVSAMDAEQVMIYFNNDYNANAVTNGQELMDILSVEKPA